MKDWAADMYQVADIVEEHVAEQVRPLMRQPDQAVLQGSIEPFVARQMGWRLSRSQYLYVACTEGLARRTARAARAAGAAVGPYHT